MVKHYQSNLVNCAPRHQVLYSVACADSGKAGIQSVEAYSDHEATKVCRGRSWDYSFRQHRPANAALLSMAPESGTDYRKPSDRQNCRYLHSSASSRPSSPSTSCAACSCVSYIPPSGAVATVVSSAPIINVPTQLNSSSSWAKLTH